MRRLDAYRKNRTERERVTRERARVLYKLSRGGVARLAFEDLGGAEPSSGHRVSRGLSLRFLVRHDLEELSVHQRAEDRATAELTASARELQALAALTTVQAMQEHVLVASEVAVAPQLRQAARRRLRMTDRLEDRAVRANRALLRAAKDNWRELRSLSGLDGSARLIRPVPGRIVGGFGEYEDKVLRLPMVRNGVELRSRSNQKVRAMADGRVVMATRLPGYEEVVVIDHGSGQYTLTAHVWEVEVEPGDEVEAGDVLARTAPKAVDDGLGESVYLELRHGEKPVDPTPYIRRALARRR
jgi:septal ring factor EnvC (AmiA/AmiB activator)